MEQLFGNPLNLCIEALTPARLREGLKGRWSPQEGPHRARVPFLSLTSSHCPLGDDIIRWLPESQEVGPHQELHRYTELNHVTDPASFVK